MMMRLVGLLLLLLERTAGFFKLCTFNVHEGGHGLEEMFSKFFVPWCEVAVVNEANGWRLKKTSVIAARHGFKVEILQTPFGYDIGVLAKKDVVTMERGSLTTSGSHDGFHHGLLHVVLKSPDQKVHLFGTHLTPHSALRRREEARQIIGLVRSLELSEDASVVVAGDMNTLSPLDDHDKSLLETLQSNPRLQAKFLVTPDSDSTIDYVPMKILLADLVDVAYSHNDKPHFTVPTLLHADKLHAAPMRLDYVLFNAKAAATLLDPQGRALHVSTLVDDYTHRASDHYPLVVDLAKPNFLALTTPQRHAANNHNRHRQQHLDSGPMTTSSEPKKKMRARGVLGLFITSSSSTAASFLIL